MAGQPGSSPFEALRKSLPLTSILLGLALIYAGWTLYSRWNASRAAARSAQQREAEADRRIVEHYGNGNLKILTFYPDPAVISRAQGGLLCYGVANAASVSIAPGVETITPSLSRCIPIHPAKNTEYTLTAVDSGGHKATQTVAVNVR